MKKINNLKYLNQFSNSPLIAIIPARGGSTRIKNKNLKKINEVSLIRKSVSTCLESKIFDRIVVSTDSAKIEEEILELNVNIHKRSKVTSDAFSSTEDVINEILNDYKVINFEKSIIYLIQCTSPFLSSDDLKNSKDKIFEKESKSHSLLSGYLSNKFIWQENNEFWHSKNYDPRSRPRTQESKKYFVENGAFYIFSES